MTNGWFVATMHGGGSTAIMAMTQQQIDQAIKDQIGTNPVATLPSNPDIAQALVNYETEGQAVADKMNGAAIANYLQGFRNWADEVVAGKIHNTNPPQPPVGLLAAKASDGWVYVIKGTDPVCSVPPVPPDPSTVIVAIGNRVFPGVNYWYASQADTAQSGYVTPSPVTTADGVTGLFQRVGFGYYQKVG